MPIPAWKIALDDPGDIAAGPGTVARARALRLKLRELLHDRFRGVQYVLQTLKAFEQERDYAALENPQGEPFSSAVQFCTAPEPYGLGWNERDIEALWQETREIALGDFLDETRKQRAQQLGATASGELAERGVIGRGRNRSYNITSNDRGTSADYLAHRLRRDAPAYADALARGEYTSVQEACVRAGIITPPAPQIAMSKSRHKAAQAIVAKMGPGYAKALAIELLELVAPVIEEEHAEPEPNVSFSLSTVQKRHQIPMAEPVEQGPPPQPVEQNGIPYDPDMYVLGKLCRYGHDYQGTGQSLRYKKHTHECVQCGRERNARKRQDSKEHHATLGHNTTEAIESEETTKQSLLTLSDS